MALSVYKSVDFVISAYIQAALSYFLVFVQTKFPGDLRHYDTDVYDARCTPLHGSTSV